MQRAQTAAAHTYTHTLQSQRKGSGTFPGPPQYSALSLSLYHRVSAKLSIKLLSVPPSASILIPAVESVPPSDISPSTLPLPSHTHTHGRNMTHGKITHTPPIEEHPQIGWWGSAATALFAMNRMHTAGPA